MGTIPGLGFKTNVKDGDFAEEIALSIADEFEEIECNKDRGFLSVDGSDGDINYTILDGANEYVGMHHDGLVFDYKPMEWPNWKEYSKHGDLMQDIRDFVDEEFEYVDVYELMPITPTT